MFHSSSQCKIFKIYAESSDGLPTFWDTSIHLGRLWFWYQECTSPSVFSPQVITTYCKQTFFFFLNQRIIRKGNLSKVLSLPQFPLFPNPLINPTGASVVISKQVVSGSYMGLVPLDFQRFLVPPAFYSDNWHYRTLYHQRATPAPPLPTSLAERQAKSPLGKIVFLKLQARA